MRNNITDKKLTKDIHFDFFTNRTVANYLLWRFIRHRVNNLDDRFEQAKQRFNNNNEQTRTPLRVFFQILQNIIRQGKSSP